MAIFSGIISITTYFGDRSLEDSVNQADQFRAAWSAWRGTEDSIRVELDHIGFYLNSDSGSLEIDNRNRTASQRMELIQRCVVQLQISEAPGAGKKSSKQIYDAVADLSLASDSLSLIVAELANRHSVLESANSINAQRRAVHCYTTVVRALNSVRNARISIVDDFNNDVNLGFKRWQRTEEFVNTAALIILGLLMWLGVLIARNYARSEEQNALQFQQLKESEARFRSVVANVPGIIFRSRIAKDWPIEFISENVEQMTGYPASDFIENRVRRFGNLIHPGDTDRMIAAVSTSIEFGTPYAIEYRLINSGGEIIWVAEHGQAVAGGDGKPQWLDGAILDITDRKRSADALAQSEETLRALIDASPGVALLLDSDGRILAANEALSRDVGISREALVGKLGYEIVAPDQIHPGWQHFRHVVELGKKIDYVQERDDKFIHVYLCPIYDVKGRVVRVAVFGQDISDWKRALNESERFKHILDSTSDIVGIIDTNNEFVYMNRACRESVNFQDTLPVTKLDFSKVYTAESLKLIQEIALPAVRRHGIWQGEAVLIAPDGNEAPVSIVFMSHRSAAVELEFISCIIRDMSDRKRVEAALARSERHLRLMTAGVPGVLYQFKINDDGSMCFPYVSDGSKSVFGVDAETVMKDSSYVFRILHPDDLDMVLASVDRNPNAKSIWQKEFRCFIDGAVHWISGSALPQEQADGTWVWNGMLIDITAQKVAEEQLRQSEERFRKIFDAAGFGIASIDFNGIIRETNRAFQEMVQYSGDELRGMNFTDITHPEDIERTIGLLEKGPASPDHSSIQYEKRYIRKDGQIIWARLTVIEFRDDKGQTGYYIGMAEDITERRQAEQKIRESETLYRTLFESSGEGLFLMTDTFIDCNERAAEIWKCERTDIYGRSPADFSPEYQPDGRRSKDAAKKFLENALSGEAQNFDWKHLRSDGVAIDTEVSLKQLEVSGSSVILATVRDVSERARIEKELRESLIQLHTLVDSAVDGIVIFKQDGEIESINPAGERIFELIASRLIGTNIIDLVAEPHRSRYMNLLRHPDSDHASSLLRGVHEVLGLKLGGYVFPMDLAISPLKLGAELKFVAIIRDISERRSAEQQIIENEARLEAILSSAGDGIIVVDSDRVIQVVNDAAQEIFGFASKELIGRRAEVIIRGIDTMPLPVQGKRSVFDSIGIHQNRGEVPLQVSISRVSVGGAESYAVIARDMTEEYNRRERLIEADKLTSIGTLAAGIAHEFKNYLAGIIGNASFALDGLNDPDGLAGAREAFEQIIAIGERADDIALSLLTYSRRREDDLELLDLRDVINSTLRFTGKELAEKNIEVITEYEEIPKVMVSANRALQVFLNLIINASQAITNAGTIRIKVYCEETVAIVRISDNGIGISNENMRRIFDPFFSTKGVWGKDAVHGTGLGLSICRNIINSFGGEISVDSAVGKGSTFTISLPIPDQEPVQMARRGEGAINSLLLFSANPEIEIAYSKSSRESGFAYRLARSEDYALGSLSMGKETLVIIDCATPYLTELIRIIEFCQANSIRMAYINMLQCSKELRQFTVRDALSFDNIPNLADLIAAIAPVRTQA